MSCKTQLRHLTYHFGSNCKLNIESFPESVPKTLGTPRIMVKVGDRAEDLDMPKPSLLRGLTGKKVGDGGSVGGTARKGSEVGVSTAHYSRVPQSVDRGLPTSESPHLTCLKF